MIVSEITLYNLLRAKIGEQEASAFLSLLESKVDKKFEEAKLTLATKEDIAKSEARITMRMFLFWIGQVAAFLAITKFIQ